MTFCDSLVDQDGWRVGDAQYWWVLWWRDVGRLKTLGRGKVQAGDEERGAGLFLLCVLFCKNDCMTGV